MWAARKVLDAEVVEVLEEKMKYKFYRWWIHNGEPLLMLMGWYCYLIKRKIVVTLRRIFRQEHYEDARMREYVKYLDNLKFRK
jgi:hypothetical protein